MKRVLISLLFAIAVVGYLRAFNKEVYFVSSAYINFDQNSEAISNVIDTSGKLSLYKVERIKDSLQVAKANLGGMLMDYKSSDVRDVLFYVHGYGKELVDVYERALSIEETYDVAVVFFYWPFKNSKGKPSNLMQAKRKIESSIPSFKAFVGLAGEVRRSGEFGNVSLLAHSLGNYFLEIYSEEGNSDFYTFDNLILNSAAVNDKKHSEWLNKIDFQRRIYVLYNKHDFLLKGLQFFTRARRQLGNSVSHVALPSVNYIDMSPLVKFQFPIGNTHSYFTGEVPDNAEQVRGIYSTLIKGKPIGDYAYFSVKQ